MLALKTAGYLKLEDVINSTSQKSYYLLKSECIINATRLMKRTTTYYIEIKNTGTNTNVQPNFQVVVKGTEDW